MAASSTQHFHGRHVAHHQHPDGLLAALADVADVALGDVGLGAVAGHADHVDAQIQGRAEVLVDRGESRNAVHAQAASGKARAGRAEHGRVVLARQTHLQRRGADAVAVPDLDDGNPGLFRGRRIAGDLRRGELVGHGVIAVAQRGIADANSGMVISFQYGPAAKDDAARKPPQQPGPRN